MSTDPASALRHALSLGHMDRVRALLAQEGAELLTVEHPGVGCALSLAIRRGHIELVPTLLALGANPNARVHLPRDGARPPTALLWAVTHAETEAVRALLAHGACVPDTRDTADPLQTPLVQAAARGHGRILRVLLGHPDATAHAAAAAAERACMRDHVDCLAALLEHEALAPAPSPLLHRAALAGAVECLRVLIARGGNVNEPHASGRTALHIAANAAFDACVEMLLSAGADVSLATSDERNTPLHDAARGGNPRCLSLLLSAGADPLARDAWGGTPRESASLLGAQCTELLIAAEHRARLTLCGSTTPNEGPSL